MRFKEAQEAIAGADGNHRVGLLAISDDSGSSTWADNMYDAVPDLTSRVAGWIEHPYGPDYRSKTNNLLAGVAPHGGGKLPLFITEYGIATDNSRCLNDNYGWPRCSRRPTSRRPTTSVGRSGAFARPTAHSSRRS